MSATRFGAGVGTRETKGPDAPAFGIGGGRAAPRVQAGQAVAVLAVVVVAVLGIAWCVVTGIPSSSARPEVFGGSIVLPHAGHDPVVADLATGRATVRLQNLKGMVSAEDIDQVTVVPTDIGTFLVNRQSGTYNLLDRDNVVVLRSGGIELPGGADPTAVVEAYPATGGLYLVRRGPARTEVYLVGRDTVLQGNTGANVKARAAASLDGRSAEGAGGALVVGDVLWIVGSVEGDGAQLTRLTPPKDPESQAFAIDEVASIDATSVLAAGRDGTVAASTHGVGRVVIAGAGSTSVRELALSTAKESRAIAPATNDGDGAWFAYRGDDGNWALVQVKADGTASDPAVIGDSRGLEHLRPPAVVGTRAWIVGSDDGSVRRLDLARRETVRPAGADKYPVIEGDNAGTDFFSDAQLIVRGPRLVINAPRALRALIIDGTSEAVSVVDKSQALDFDASAPPSPQIQAGDPSGAAPPANGGQAPPSTQPVKVKDPVTDEQSCQNLSQTPRKPRMRSLEPTDKSLTATWDYVKLDPGDCQPSSYLIEIHGVGGTEDPPNPVRAHTTAELQFSITGLRPNRTYEVRVTAVIGNNRTTSEPMQRKTDDAGPDPARSVTTNAQQPGGWQVAWAACQGNECDVAAVQWEVSWSLCGTGGFVGQQEPITGLAAGQREARLDLAQHPDLVGKSLTFTVTAISAAGQRASTPDGACNEGWNKPNGAQVVLTADGREENGTVTITASVEQTPDPEAAIFGGSSPTFTYSSDGVTVGPTPAKTVELKGLAAGQPHDVKATVTVHGLGAEVKPATVPAVFRGWPPMSATLAINPRPGSNMADLVVTVKGAPADTTVQAQVDANCEGNPLPSPIRELQNGTITWSADLVTQLAPTCTADIKLFQPENAIYSGPISLPLAAVSIPPLTPPTVTGTWEKDPGPFGSAHVVFTGTIPTNGADWELVPTRTEGFCHNAIQLGAGPIPSWARMDPDCVNDQDEIILQWRYLKTLQQVKFKTSNPRPQPEVTTTTTSTTTPASTTTTRPTTTTTKATTTTTASFVGDGTDPLLLALGLAGFVGLLRGTRRVRARRGHLDHDRADHDRADHGRADPPPNRRRR